MNFILVICNSALAALKTDVSGLIRRLTLPVILMIAGGLVAANAGLKLSAETEISTLSGLVVAGAILALTGYLMLVVSVHRHVLATEIGNDNATGTDGMAESVILYLLWSIGLGLLTAFIAIPLLAIFGAVLGTNGASPLNYLVLLAAAPAAYVFSRLCLVLPDRALGRSTDLAYIWQYSHGNGWKLVLVILGIPFFINLLVSLVVSVLPAPIGSLLSSLINLPILVFCVTLMSVAYRDLRGIAKKGSV